LPASVRCRRLCGAGVCAVRKFAVWAFAVWAGAGARGDSPPRPFPNRGSAPDPGGLTTPARP
jgi:hypothetical protein